MLKCSKLFYEKSENLWNNFRLLKQKSSKKESKKHKKIHKPVSKIETPDLLGMALQVKKMMDFENHVMKLEEMGVWNPLKERKESQLSCN